MRDSHSKNLAQRVVGDEFAGQRLDNYLLREWRGVPRSLVYRLIRNGHVRVNAGRVKPDCRLQAGDCLRLPASVAVPQTRAAAPAAPLQLPVLYEDAQLLAVDKPAGLAVHGGSGIAHGVIERLRARLPQNRFLELAHRLDRETSGVLLLAKKRTALAAVQKQWREHQVKKRYVALVFGEWQAARHRRIALPLKRLNGSDGHRQVVADAAGKNAVTHTQRLNVHGGGALLAADLSTGRTHQLRVHLAASDIPIVGDDKYGDFTANRAAARAGFSRMFLHAERLTFTHPLSGKRLSIVAPPAQDFTHAAAWLERHSPTPPPPPQQQQPQRRQKKR